MSPLAQDVKFKSEIVDKDLGWRAIQKVMLKADGLEIRAGWLTGKPKYPKERGGASIALVSAVQFGFEALSEVWDQNEARLDGIISAATKLAMTGKDPTGRLEKIGVLLARAVKQEVRNLGLIDRGLLIGDVKAALYERRVDERRKTGLGRPLFIREIETGG